MLQSVIELLSRESCEMHEKELRVSMPPIVSKQPSPTVTSSNSPSPSRGSRHRHDRPILVQPHTAGHNNRDDNVRETSISDVVNGFHGTCVGKPDNDNNISSTVDGVSDLENNFLVEDEPRMRTELSSRREIVQLLDAEPTFGYLVQNGVLTAADIDDIVAKKEPSSQNYHLLRLLESRRDVAGVRLLTNVLRLTGQHYLANLLDDGARIKALSGSGYLSKSRHKGQVSVTIRIRSMQLPADPQLKAVSALLGTEWISLEDIQMKISSLKRSQQLHTVAPADVNPIILTDPNPTKDVKHGCCWRCCCCCCNCCECCCSCCRTAPVTDKRPPNPEHGKPENPALAPERKSLVVTYQPGRLKSTSIECLPIGESGSNVDSLRRAADNIQSRCMTVYTAVAEPFTPLRVGIERYFEQDRGILVLGAESLGAGGGATVFCICTRPDHVKQLRSDQAEKLVVDLEKVISTATGARVRLAVIVDGNDLDLAEDELKN